MAYISLIQPENASAEVKEVYEQKLKGKPGNAQKVMAHRPEMLKGFLGFYPTVGRSLDRKLYELIYIRVSFINECHYCLQHHLASSKRAGVTPEDWAALKIGNHSHLSEKERAALLYAEELTRAPGEIEEADVEELKKHFSDAEILDLHLLVGVANLTNRFTGPLGLELEFPAETI
jgi:uncharacterized peroxidase-related enzyme